jgi:hypothetical protein
MFKMTDAVRCDDGDEKQNVQNDAKVNERNRVQNERRKRERKRERERGKEGSNGCNQRLIKLILVLHFGS